MLNPEKNKQNGGEVCFIPASPNELLQVGAVIRLGPAEADEMLRVTHIFSKNLYVIPVSTPRMVRFAGRPVCHSVSLVEHKIEEKKWQLGRLKMPPDFLIASEDCDINFSAIEPLINRFEDERALSRNSFINHISQRADELGINVATLRRLVLRYYYFGRNKFALQDLKRGPRFSTSSREDGIYVGREKTQKRRGRQPAIAQILGPNDFLVTDDDIADMVSCFEKLVAKRATSKVEAHAEYLRTYFKKRHPQKYQDFLDRKCPLPVTMKQFRDTTKKYATIKRVHAGNVAGAEKRARTGTAEAAGPGEVYEIDATGGRIHIVDSKDPSLLLGTPIIYLIVDRWSRFIVSIYLSLRPASWEEIRSSLMIAFTPRKRRFKMMGVDVDEEQWPQGRICSRLVNDRGSEMISKAMLEAAVDGLHIQPDTLPPLCPDGKGVIERLNRELKRQMAQRGLKGTFVKRPTDPKAHRAFKAAQTVAVHSLRQVYWELIKIVNRHNNSSHTHLEKKPILRMAGVKPTPKDAYLWGLKNITGLEHPPLDESDYQKILMSVQKATIANGAIMWRNRKYFSANAVAERQARKSTSRRTSIEIRVDLSDPIEIHVAERGQEWGLWQVNAAGLQDLSEITIEEEDGLSGAHKLLIAAARNDTLINDQIRAEVNSKTKQPKAAPRIYIDAASRRERRSAETNEIKDNLMGKSSTKPSTSEASQEPNVNNKKGMTWEELERTEKLDTLARMRRGRK